MRANGMARTDRIALLLLSIAILSVAVSCRRHERGPELAVRRFFRAMNEKDVNQLLSCVDPRQERMFKATFRLVEKATGFPLDDVLELLPGLHQAFGSEMPEDIHFTRIRVRSREHFGTKARLRVTVRSTYRARGMVSAQDESFEFTLEYFREHGWRIVSMYALAPDANRGPTTHGGGTGHDSPASVSRTAT
jgi:hypothetical protein